MYDPIVIDELRNIAGYVNRVKKPSELNYKAIEQVLSPPFKGRFQRARQDGRMPIADYPKQLSGLHNPNNQQIRIAGSTGGGTLSYGGIYGTLTGGSYAT